MLRAVEPGLSANVSIVSWPAKVLHPAPYPRAVAAIDVSELALEIGFLAGDHTVADDKREGHQRRQQPEAVEGNGQADEPQHHAEIDGVAREAIRASLHDGRGRQPGGHVRAGPGHGRDRPRDQRQRKGNYYRAEPACRYRGRQEWQGHEPVEREPGKHRERPRDRRPDNDVRGICRVSHGGTGEPALLLMWPAEDYLQA